MEQPKRDCLAEGILAQLAERYRETRDISVFEPLLLLEAPRIRSFAEALLQALPQVEELVAEGEVGVINAAARYKPDGDIDWTTLVTHYISGQIRAYLRDRGVVLGLHEQSEWFRLAGWKPNR